MNLEEIKEAVRSGKIVHWVQENYVVIRDKFDRFLIMCTSNNNCIGLTWRDGVTMNGQEHEFYIGDE